MRKAIWAGAMVLAVGTTRAADLASTFVHDPTLAREANPLVSWLGYGPQGMLITNIGQTLLLLVAILLYWRLPTKRVNREEVNNVWAYASFCLFNEVFPRRRFLTAMLLGHPLPRDLCQAFRLLAFVVAWAVTAGGVLGALSWWSTRWNWVWFRRIYSAGGLHGYPVMLVALCLAVAVLAAIAFFRTEYAEANNAMQTAARTARG